MTDSHSPTLGSGLSIEERLPLRWHAGSDVPEACCHPPANEEVLRTILALDEHHHAERSDEDPAIAQEFARLESRIDLVLELVSQVLARQVGLPEAVPVRLAAHTVAWQSPVPVSGVGALELYVSARYPRPLFLPVEIERGSGDWVQGRLGDLGETVQDLIEQLLFRHHRRQIAAARRGG